MIPTKQPILSKQPIQIQKGKLLIVEGKDEYNFFSELLNAIGIYDVQVLPIGGKTQFKNKFNVLRKTPNFNKISILGICQDADDDPAGRFNSIVNVLKTAGFKCPNNPYIFSKSKPKIGIFIMPGGNNHGALEDLCLKLVYEDPVLDCVEKYIRCLKDIDIHPKNLAKAKIQTYLASKQEIVSAIGLAAKKRYWNFNSPYLEELKSFLFGFSEKN